MHKTLEEKREILTELLEEHHMETYIGYAVMCKKMAYAVEAMRMSTDMGIRDDIEMQNLYTLTQLLPICAELFQNCDEFYRSSDKELL